MSASFPLWVEVNIQSSLPPSAMVSGHTRLQKTEILRPLARLEGAPPLPGASPGRRAPVTRRPLRSGLGAGAGAAEGAAPAGGERQAAAGVRPARQRIPPVDPGDQARGKKRQIGWFPANYVKLLSPGTSKITPTEPPKPTALPAVCQVIGMYDYIAQNDDELAFNKGQIINVLNKEDPDWWKGEVNGQVGLFPSNYVKLTTDMDPSQQ